MVYLTDDMRHSLPNSVTSIIFPFGLEVIISHAFRSGCSGL